jgi:hypothetical protein
MALPEGAVRIDQDPTHELYAFSQEVTRISEVVAKACARMRPDAMAVRPAVLVYRGSGLGEDLKAGISDNVQAGFKGIVYSPLEHVVYMWWDKIQELTEGERDDQWHLSLVIAEEFMHAQTTRVYPDKTRVGFLNVPAIRTGSPYPDGSTFDISGAVNHLSGTPSHKFSKEDQEDVILLERATQLLLHFIVDQIIINKNKPFTQFFLTTENGKPLLGGRPNRQIFADVFGALYFGNKRLLQTAAAGDLLKILSLGKLHFASYPDKPFKDEDMLMIGL